MKIGPWLVTAIAATLLLLAFIGVSTVFSIRETGKICIAVYDGFTLEPIENAKVVIPEIDKTLYTGTDGKTDIITVPVLPDEHYNELKKQEYGRITVLVYADGYLPYGLFFAHVYPDTTRSPNIWLFEDDGGEPFVIIESPNPVWANEIIERYK